MKQFLLALVIVSCITCSNNANKKAAGTGSYADSPPVYNIEQPDKVFTMPHALKELSGIDKIDKNHLACIEDEHGIIYIYDLEKESVTKEIKFSGGGDFEDIALNGDTAYVLRSDGFIFRVDNYNGLPVTSTINTSLNSKANTEGLYFDKRNHRLLIACKGQVDSKEIPKHTKVVYAFNLKTNKIERKPFLLIDQKAIEAKLGERNAFSPSAITKDPLSGDIYVAATAGRLLITFSSAGTMKNIQRLTGKYFIQPEGLCITEEGDLYISNEGRNGRANILLFKRHALGDN